MVGERDATAFQHGTWFSVLIALFFVTTRAGRVFSLPPVLLVICRGFLPAGGGRHRWSYRLLPSAAFHDVPGDDAASVDTLLLLGTHTGDNNLANASSSRLTR